MGKYIINITAALIILFALGWYADSVAHKEIVWLLRVAPYVLVIGLALGILIVLSFAVLAGYDWWMSKRADRRLKEREVNVMVIDSQHGLYAREMDKRAVWRPLHLNPGAYQNGVQVTPTPEERQTWLAWTLRNAPAPVIEAQAQSPMMLPAPEQVATLPDYVDLADYAHPGVASIRNMFLGVGKFPNGEVKPVRAPLYHFVHIATGGATGFGKSFFMRSLAYQALNAREKPDVILLDAQRVTFTPFEGDSRLNYPVTGEPGVIAEILKDLVREMDSRGRLFAQWRGVENLDSYNRATGGGLPAIIIYLDEFGLVANDKAIAGAVDRLAKGGRKFGMYIISAAQSWYSDEIASSLKTNLSTAVQFRANSRSQSRVLLDDSIAATITQPGRAYCRLPGQAGLIELQAPDTSTVIDVVPEYLGAVEEPETPEEKLELTNEEERIFNLYETGKSISTIAKEVYGSKGGPQNEKVRTVLRGLGERV